MTILFFILLTVIVLFSSYTDLKYRKIYNKFLLPCLIVSLGLHALDGTLIASLIAMTVAFLFFFLAYVFGMTSPGDVKLFAVTGSVVANMAVITSAILAYMLIQLGMAVYALVKVYVKEKMSVGFVLKRDLMGFITKTGSAIQPIRFPGAVVIGGSVWCVQVLDFILR